MKFNLSKIRISRYDVGKDLILPKYTSKELAEFIGILIGDGYIYHNYSKYIIGIVGNPKTDGLYFLKIQKLIKDLFNLQTSFKKRGRGLRLVFNSKGVFHFLTEVLQIPYGKGKGTDVIIPSFFLKNRVVETAILRGIFDTDGSIFCSDKKGAPNYPCIELTTTSKLLAHQVNLILRKLKFKVAKIRSYQYKHSKLLSYKVSLYGKGNMEKWHTTIGFSNPNKQKRLEKIMGPLGFEFLRQN